MYEGGWISRVTGRAAAISLAAIISAAVLPCGAFAESDAPAAGKAAAASPKVRELMTSLAQEWLEEQGVAKPPAPAAQQTGASFDDYVNSAAGAIHGQIVALASAI